MKINDIFDKSVSSKIRTKNNSPLSLIASMATVKFTSALKRFFPTISEMELPVNTVREMLNQVDKTHPGILNYLTEDNGQLRKHVNIFVKGELIKDRIHLNDAVTSRDEVLIFQALSGG